MRSEINEVMQLLEKEDFALALERSEELVGKSMTSFMEELTVNTATDYVGSALLYSQICAMMKKPWLVFPKLEACRGAVRFLDDYISDRSVLAETYFSVAEAYAYGGYLPEAIGCFRKAALATNSEEEGRDALSSAFFYQARFGKPVQDSADAVANQFSAELLATLEKEAVEEAKTQILTDPVENTDAYLTVRFEAEQETEKRLSEALDDPRPFCLRYWTTKKTVLKECFGLDWKSPEEMNPHIRFY